MVVFHLVSIPLTTSVRSTASKKSLTRAQCVICFGPTLMTAADGGSHPVVLVTHSVRIFRRRLIRITDLRWWREHISWLWRGIIGVKTETLLPSFLVRLVMLEDLGTPFTNN